MRLIGENNKLLATPESRVGPNYAIAVTSVSAMLIPICLPAYLAFGLSLILPYVLQPLGYERWMTIPVSIPVGAATMFYYFLAGRGYISWFRRFGFGSKTEILEPLFRSSMIVFGLIAGFWIFFAVSLPYTSNILSALCYCGGLTFFLLGQKHQIQKLEASPPERDPMANLESVTRSGEFIDRMFALKEAENIEHLEQLSKQCLVLLKPASTSARDCTSILIDELMKNKLLTEANELSSLQLKLIDQDSSYT